MAAMIWKPEPIKIRAKNSYAGRLFAKAHSPIKIKDEASIKEEILPGYGVDPWNSINEDDITFTGDLELKGQGDFHCWNCCSKLDKFYKSIPIKYANNIFYIHGYFCNNSCSLRYLYDKYEGTELWTKYELLNFYCSKIYGENIIINPAPNRLSLKNFGGNLTVEEYRSNNINYIEINTPPIIPVNNPNIKYENTKINENKEGLKLYRKKSKEKKDGILNNMKL